MTTARLEVDGYSTELAERLVGDMHTAIPSAGQWTIEQVLEVALIRGLHELEREFGRSAVR